MDDLELLERERYRVFALAWLLVYLGLVFWVNPKLLAFFIAIAIALLVSGYHVAKTLTSEFFWVLLEAEARVNGRMPSKRGIWVGNLLPGLLVLSVVGYVNRVA